MKHNLLNCYIDGKKAAIAIVNDVIYLFSHTAQWNGERLPNMLGWKYAKRVCNVGPHNYAPAMAPGYISEILHDFAGFPGTPAVIVDGTPEFDAIRANIRKCPGRKVTGRKTEPKTAPAPVPEPAPVPAPVTVTTPAPSPAPAKLVHAKFNDILALMNAGKSVYLHGPAGSGKNVICEQIAEAMGLEFYYTNTVFDKCELSGYNDAMGIYRDTQFYRAFKNGGLFMLDEVDVSIPEALTTINGALSCKYYTFGSELVKRHPDFKCIVAGNTAGTGADEMYNTRAKLDESTRNRFAFVPVDYDPRIEKAAAGGDVEILEFMRDLRKAAKKSNISIITGYRCMKDLADLKNTCISVADRLEYLVFKGMDKDERNILFAGLKYQSNEYARAMCY
jgi:hypothetical protein